MTLPQAFDLIIARYATIILVLNIAVYALLYAVHLAICFVKGLIAVVVGLAQLFLRLRFDNVKGMDVLCH